ncbi:hypothetical protein [Bradyrhizobium sp.]|uniref:hypothetical protein n=1 Tax=Bradyrhizobium sp. TaxID=376 RepID=UPI0007C908DE|nr:hypothetical protein [Bradyrhizobium sp.]
MDAIVEKPDKKKGTQVRALIGPDDVKSAAAAAKASPPGDEAIHDINDTELPYLTLRRRGKAVRWVVRSHGKTKVFGSAIGIHVDRTYLTLRAARDRAKRVYVELADAGPAAAIGETWTWGDLDREYQAMMSKPRYVNRRRKPASKSTSDDIRLAFAKPSLQALHPKRLTKLGLKALEDALEKIESFRQREKCCAYFKAALTWAASKKRSASGLTADTPRWWNDLSAGDPDEDTMDAMEARREILLLRKSELEVGHIGELLARHERYCDGREAEEKISPGIRFGLWWVCLTANRRTSTVKLLRKGLKAEDEFNPGMGRAMWPADTMKAKIPFWLPLPPAVRDVALGSIADYTQLVANGHGSWSSKWVFASTRRHGRNPDNDDVSVYPNSLNKHIRVMREGQTTKSKRVYAPVLDGLPYFSLHLARTVMANFIDKHVSPRASSLVLAHTLPQTDKEASTTTIEHYLTTQRMEIKSEAMMAWTEALIAAVKAAGGSLPTPKETPRASKIRNGKGP